MENCRVLPLMTGHSTRENFFNKHDELRELSQTLSDTDIDNLTRGGHDPIKIHAAFDAATRHKGHPTVVPRSNQEGVRVGSRDRRADDSPINKRNLPAMHYSPSAIASNCRSPIKMWKQLNFIALLRTARKCAISSKAEKS